MKTTSATLLGMMLLSPLVAALVITSTRTSTSVVATMTVTTTEVVTMTETVRPRSTTTTLLTKVVTVTVTPGGPEVATMTATLSLQSAGMSTIGRCGSGCDEEPLTDSVTTLSTSMVITLVGTEVATRTWIPFGTEVVTMTITPGGPGLITVTATPSRRSADMSSIGRRGCDGDEEPLADSDGTVQHVNLRSTIGPRSAGISSDQIAQYEAANERFREQMDNMN